jgi:hypothetical protein
VQQDALRSVNRYDYALNNPVTLVDSEGLQGIWVGFLHIGQTPSLVFDAGSWQQLGMSARATAGGFISGLTLGVISPDWRDPCDPYADVSAGLGFAAGAVMNYAGPRIPQAKMFQPFWRYWNPTSKGGPWGPWLTRGGTAPYGLSARGAQQGLALQYTPEYVTRVRVPWWEPVRGGGRVLGQFGQPGGGLEWYRPLYMYLVNR